MFVLPIGAQNPGTPNFLFPITVSQFPIPDLIFLLSIHEWIDEP